MEFNENTALRFKLAFNEVSEELKRKTAEALFLEIIQRWPVGELPDRHIGLSRASNSISLGSPMYLHLPDRGPYETPGIERVDEAFNSNGNTSKIFIVNDAAERNQDPYSSDIEGGLEEGSGGRMTGSSKAPNGVYGPSLDSVESRKEAIENAAINSAYIFLAS